MFLNSKKPSTARKISLALEGFLGSLGTGCDGLGVHDLCGYCVFLAEEHPCRPATRNPTPKSLALCYTMLCYTLLLYYALLHILCYCAILFFCTMLYYIYYVTVLYSSSVLCCTILYYTSPQTQQHLAVLPLNPKSAQVFLLVPMFRIQRLYQQRSALTVFRGESFRVQRL